MSTRIVRPGFSFGSELRDGSRLGEAVYREFAFLHAQLDDVLTSLGVNQQGIINNLTVNNLNVQNINGSSAQSGLLLRATRSFDAAQIATLPTIPLALFSPTGLGLAPGLGYALNPVRGDWSLNTVGAAFGNVASDCYITLSLGSDTTPFGPRTVAAQLMTELAIQQPTVGMFEPSSYKQFSGTFENQTFYVWLNNGGLGNLTGGSGATLVVNEYYVVTPIVVGTAANTIVYTTTARKVEPPAATRIAVTPSGTNQANSNWFEVDSATSADWALAAIAFNPGVSDVYVEFDVGVGGAGSETVVATICGYIQSENTCPNHRLAWMIPIGGLIGTGDRVAVRMRKTGTNTTNWSVALEYFEEPMAGNAVVSPVAATLSAGPNGAVAITPSITAGAYSAWFTDVANAPLTSDMVIGANNVTILPVAPQYEMTLGENSMTPKFKSRAVANNISALGYGGMHSQMCYPALPIIRTGNALSCRVRKSGTSTATWFVNAHCYQGIAFPLLTTEQSNIWYPDTGTTLASVAYSGSTWTDGAYTALFTTTTPIALTAVLINIDANSNDIEIDIATGTPSNEVVVSRVRVPSDGQFSGDIQPVAVIPARNIAAGEIISVRRRSASSGGVAVGLSYIENPDFYQRIDTVAVIYPAAANAVSVAGNTVAWNNSNYGELVSATASAVYLTHLNFATTLTNIDVEFDLATGAASSETVIGTFTTYIGHSSGGGTSQIAIVPPISVATGSRIAVRFRKTGTSATGFTFSAMATPTA